jgi:hypothetical protein
MRGSYAQVALGESAEDWRMTDMVSVAAKGAVIDRPVHAVWTFMIDASNMALWEDSGAAWTQTSKGPVALDTTFESSIRKLGREITFPLRVTEFDLDRTFAVEATAGFAKGTTFRYVMESVGDHQTKLNRVTEPHFHGVAGLMYLFAAPATRWAGELEARNVKRVLESRPS